MFVTKRAFNAAYQAGQHDGATGGLPAPAHREPWEDLAYRAGFDAGRRQFERHLAAAQDQTCEAD